MKDLFLSEPKKAYQKSFEEYARAYQEIKDDAYLEKYQKALEDFDGLLNDLQNHSKGIDLPEGMPVTTTYWLIDDGEVVGVLRLRHQDMGTMGHIGYDISPRHRGKGYGNHILQLALKEASQMGLAEAILTCNTENAASKKIIENNGGEWLGEIYDEEENEYLYKYRIPLKMDEGQYIAGDGL